MPLPNSEKLSNQKLAILIDADNAPSSIAQMLLAEVSFYGVASVICHKRVQLPLRSSKSGVDLNDIAADLDVAIVHGYSFVGEERACQPEHSSGRELDGTARAASASTLYFDSWSQSSVNRQVQSLLLSI